MNCYNPGEDSWGGMMKEQCMFPNQDSIQFGEKSAGGSVHMCLKPQSVLVIEVACLGGVVSVA